MSKIEILCILGGHIQALGLARQAKNKNVKVTLIIPDRFSVARFSRYVDKVIVCNTENSLIQCLDDNQSKSTMIFPTSDDYINFIVRHYKTLNESYTIGLPDLSVTKLFADKTLSYKFAESNNIAHPWSKYPKSMQDVYEMASQLEYPIVVKPAIMYDFHKKFGKKAFLCENREALIKIMTDLTEARYPVDALILQEFLPGGSKNLYSYGFFAVEGAVRSSIIVNRIRQNPMDFGNSTTFAITTSIPEIEEISKRIIKLTRYTGMGEVEFMLDKGIYKFLEINTRAWKWHTISEGRGFSFIGDWIDWLNNNNQDERSIDTTKCAWVERLTDFAVILKGLFKKQFKVRDIIHSYNQKKVNAVWNIKDPYPAIMYILMSPILYFKRF